MRNAVRQVFSSFKKKIKLPIPPVSVVKCDKSDPFKYFEKANFDLKCNVLKYVEVFFIFIFIF